MTAFKKIFVQCNITCKIKHPKLLLRAFKNTLINLLLFFIMAYSNRNRLGYNA